MKLIYFVTEGPTDQIVIEGLIDHWLGGEDFFPRYIQPPSSAYSDGLNTNLSEGWKGVRDWCAGKRAGGPAGRDEALNQADCLIIHIDADVATDPDFKTPAFNGPCPPAKNACDWIHDHLTSYLAEPCQPMSYCASPRKTRKLGCSAHCILMWLRKTSPSSAGKNQGGYSSNGSHTVLYEGKMDG